MSTDKPLADVQPGGRVRLSDVLPEDVAQALATVNEVANDARHAGNYRVANALVHARVALSKQLLALSARQPVCNYEIQTENGPLKCSLAVYAEWQKNEEYIARLEEELKSARQPVGEPVAVVTTSERFTYGKLNRDLPDGTNLYAAPPAQAVDTVGPGPYLDEPDSPSNPLWKRLRSIANWLTELSPNAYMEAAELLLTASARIRKMGEAPPAQAVEMSPEFTDTARAAIAWVLWHHQGGSSPVGQPLRFALGMGQHDRMTDQQIAEAKRFAAWANATTEDFHQRAPAQDVELAPDHRGMRVDYHGLLGRSQEALRQRPELAEMVRQLHGHLTELGRRWYAGDRSVVDEFLQLYVIEADGRRELISSGSVCHSRPTWSVLQIGNEGAFYDPKGARRAFTYEKQPGNVIAGILGNATFGEYSGDSIDRGLALLKYLQEQGFGVFQTGEKVGQ